MSSETPARRTHTDTFRRSIRRVNMKMKKEEENRLKRTARRSLITIAKQKEKRPPFDASKLPLEMLLEIGQHLKRCNNFAKPLTQTCHRFNQVVTETNLIVRVDLNKIKRVGEYPEFQRVYSDMKIFGNGLFIDRSQLRKTLRSSQQSLTKLQIGERGIMTKLKLRDLAYILKFFPNLKELKFLPVQINQISIGNVHPSVFPKFTNLKKLTIQGTVGREFGLLLKNMTGLEELRTQAQSVIKKKIYRNLVLAQTQLKTFEASVKHLALMGRGSLPSLINLEVFAISHANVRNFFETAPNVQKIKMKRHQFGYFMHFQSHELYGASTTLKHLEVDHHLVRNFDFQEICNTYPSLEVFKSRTINWRKFGNEWRSSRS